MPGKGSMGFSAQPSSNQLWMARVHMAVVHLTTAAFALAEPDDRVAPAWTEP